MKLDKIITLTGADPWNRLRFTAMERSLRAVGCQLPCWVIPYGNERFPLPDNAKWWEVSSFNEWLSSQGAKPLARKYICLTEQNYHFVDTDIIFLKNPESVLAPHTGFITSCGHWHNPHNQTYTSESLPFLRRKSTLWQKFVFNTGQFACDRLLYTHEQLRAACTQPGLVDTLLHFSISRHEQPGLNLLVNNAGVPIVNLTLPPTNMESTWAGDYDSGDYARFWYDETLKPYLIHWAGVNMSLHRPINTLFSELLTEQEKEEWERQVVLRYTPKPVKKKYGLLQPVAARLKKISRTILSGKHKK